MGRTVRPDTRFTESRSQEGLPEFDGSIRGIVSDVSSFFFFLNTRHVWKEGILILIENFSALNKVGQSC